MSTNNTGYSCHIKAVELLNQSYGVHITPHHATSYLQPWGLTYTQIHTHAYRHQDKTNSKKQGAHRPAASIPVYKDFSICDNFINYPISTMIYMSVKL